MYNRLTFVITAGQKAGQVLGKTLLGLSHDRSLFAMVRSLFSGYNSSSVI